ncbi:hypothetical protein [Bacterioplanoides sp.]|uniref:hypothetical protein n=1 Tax=Bacterioplanoides sp. TaxID=2066072 RepID=UPI003B5C5148
MEFIKRFVFVIVCLFAAIACYTFGIPQGGVLFLIAGLVFEGLFWFGLVGKKKQPKH